MSNSFATPQATQDFFSTRSVHPSQIHQLDDLCISSLAIGTYLGASDSAGDKAYEEALVAAVQSGINFIDTAINYRCQRSEKNIAYALRKLEGLGIPRKSLVVATKGGFLPADGDPSTFESYIYKSFLNTGLIKPEDIVAGCHCMTPAYLSQQITTSLSNLKIRAIDLYYLHNPETQIKHTTAAEFDTRLTAAFGAFEQAVSEGKIKRYGIATWEGLRKPHGAVEGLDLNRVLACAKAAAGGDNHHFKAIQLPHNLALLEASLLPNQNGKSGPTPTISLAKELGLFVMTSAGLLQSKLAALPKTISDAIPGENSSAQKALHFAASTSGVSSALVGMKSVAHVTENTNVLNKPALTHDDWNKIVAGLVRNR